ncbi:hypothetical protein AAY473_040415 [Plecturocebus cupreus]
MCQHAGLIFFVLLVETGFHHVGRAGLQLLTCDVLVSATRSGEITGVSHCAGLLLVFIQLKGFIKYICDIENLSSGLCLCEREQRMQMSFKNETGSFLWAWPRQESNIIWKQGPEICAIPTGNTPFPRRQRPTTVIYHSSRIKYAAIKWDMETKGASISETGMEDQSSRIIMTTQSINLDLEKKTIIKQISKKFQPDEIKSVTC